MTYVPLTGADSVSIDLPDRFNRSGDTHLEWWLSNDWFNGYVINDADKEKLNERDALFALDATDGDLTLTLPESPDPGRPYRFYRVDGSANAITIQVFPASGQTIDGAGSISLPNQYDKAELMYATGGLGGPWARWI